MPVYIKLCNAYHRSSETLCQKTMHENNRPMITNRSGKKIKIKRKIYKAFESQGMFMTDNCKIK